MIDGCPDAAHSDLDRALPCAIVVVRQIEVVVADQAVQHHQVMWLVTARHERQTEERHVVRPRKR